MYQALCSGLYVDDHIQYSSGPSQKDSVTTPILQTRKLRQRELG